MSAQSKRITYFQNAGHCPVALKLKFTFRTASAVARSIRRQNESNHETYRCRSCGAWHVGSSELGRPPEKRPQPRVVRVWDLGEAA